ncbi:hypothetical protein DIPPA_12221 [Diplonema papillatum]|nr:hypothetical protein DIPPA_12221 [Diplonema papillatum]
MSVSSIFMLGAVVATAFVHAVAVWSLAGARIGTINEGLRSAEEELHAEKEAAQLKERVQTLKDAAVGLENAAQDSTIIRPVSVAGLGGLQAGSAGPSVIVRAVADLADDVQSTHSLLATLTHTVQTLRITLEPYIDQMSQRQDRMLYNYI